GSFRKTTPTSRRYIIPFFRSWERYSYLACSARQASRRLVLPAQAIAASPHTLAIQSRASWSKPILRHCLDCRMAPKAVRKSTALPWVAYISSVSSSWGAFSVLSRMEGLHDALQNRLPAFIRPLAEQPNGVVPDHPFTGRGRVPPSVLPG